MKIEIVAELYHLISKGTQNVFSRKQSIQLRKTGLASCTSDQGFKKLAFDTRRINQEEEYIPRRGLQNYHRSEKFISDGIANKIKSFTRLSSLLDKLKLEYGKQPEWQDSYTRVLASAVHKGLRTAQADGDFSDAQPSMASLDYLEELMYVRYRMTPDNMLAMSETELRESILKKDELLLSKAGDIPEFAITPSDVSKYSYDQMMDKMLSTIAQVMSSYKPPQPDDNLTSKLFDVKATKDTPEVERTVIITVKDKVMDRLQKNSEQVEKNSKTAQDEIVVE